MYVFNGVISFLITLDKWKLTAFNVNIVSNPIKINLKFHVVNFALRD